MKTALLVVILTVLLAGCGGVAASRAEDHLFDFTCKGKGQITGTGSANGTGIVGVSGSNNWTIQADCGDGFSIQKGVQSTPSNE